MDCGGEPAKSDQWLVTPLNVNFLDLQCSLKKLTQGYRHMQTASSSPIPQGKQARFALKQIGLTEAQARRIAEAVIAARAEYLDGIDPANAPGIKAYQAGIRQLRLEMLPAGWETGRFRNIEVVINYQLGLMLGFQNVDKACQEGCDPQSISERGPGTRSLVALPYQEDLFNSKSTTNLERKNPGLHPVVWFICVAASIDTLQVEVSRPKPFDGPNFKGFFERIFVLNENAEAVESAADDEIEELDDLEVTVSRKPNGNA